MPELENKENQEPSELSHYQICIENRSKLIKQFKDEIEALQKESANKDHCIHSCIKGKNEDKVIRIQHVRDLKALEETAYNTAQKLCNVKTNYGMLVKRYSSVNEYMFRIKTMLEDGKVTIKNNEIAEGELQNKLENAKTDLAACRMEYDTLNAECSETERKMQETNQNSKYKRELTELEIKVKELEDKIAYLEQKNQEKSEECLVLTAKYDELLEKPQF